MELRGKCWVLAMQLRGKCWVMHYLGASAGPEALCRGLGFWDLGVRGSGVRKDRGLTYVTGGTLL